MRRQLSSRYTYMYRWVIPSLLTVGAVTTIGFFAVQSATGSLGTRAALTGVAIALIFVLIARIFDRAKWVWLENEYLIVSDSNQELTIEIGEIERIGTTPYFWPHRVRIWFRQPTIFGDNIAFFPPLSLRPPLVSRELQELRSSNEKNNI